MNNLEENYKQNFLTAAHTDTGVLPGQQQQKKKFHPPRTFLLSKPPFTFL